MNPLNSYECRVCGKCYNGDADIEFGDFNAKRQCDYICCDHKGDRGISRRIYERHMNTDIHIPGDDATHAV